MGYINVYYNLYTRNWMAALAYEKAEQGDYSVIQELTTLLEHPYSDPSITAEAVVHDQMVPPGTTTGVGRVTATAGTTTPIRVDKWYRKTPDWAQHMPGVAFMS